MTTAMPQDKAGLFHLEDRHKHLPRGTGTFGMWLLIISLGMLFASSMVGYLIIRLVTLHAEVSPVTGQVVRQAGPALGTIHMPVGLWVSSLVLIASSFSIHLALRSIRLERQPAFRVSLAVTAALAVLFLVVQTPNLWSLLQAHSAYEAQLQHDATVSLLPYGLAMFLIILHALHLVGGMIPLGVVTHKAWRHQYDHESHNPVKYLAMYWHFLDIVWLCMFAGFLLIG